MPSTAALLRRMLLIASSVWVLLALDRPPASQSVLTLRFHHVHYRVEDPSAAMGAAAASTERAARVLLQGFGVGVRTGREFLLFDRLEEADGTDTAQQPLATAYATAAASLHRLGFSVDPAAANQSPAIAANFRARYDHIAFATDDFAALITRVRNAGVPVLSERDDALMVDLGDSLRVELVRDPGRPDAYWCPMHPDVRSADGDRCPICGMDLVSIPPPKVGEYKLDVRLERARGSGAVRRIRLAVREPDTHALVTRFTTVHEKPFHLFIVGRDLRYFEHLHPQQEDDGSFSLAHALPHGEYMLIADFLPEGGTPQMVQRAIISGGVSGGSPRRVAGPAGHRRHGDEPSASAVKDGLSVSLEAGEVVAGKEVLLTFTVTDARTGRPVTDLEPFLGAPAHMLIVRSDLEDVIHAHPEEQSTGGPTVSFHPLIPAPGEYRLWIQFQRGGRVITVALRLPAAR